MEVIFFFFGFVALVSYTFMRQQRWFKKILFYYFPKVLRPLSYKLKPINMYMRTLSPEERKRFEWRVYYFLDTTDIVFKHFKPGQVINFNAVRYLIASVATEMTLFMTEDCFDAFDKILIYPDKYYSRITGQYHKGETNPSAGIIVLSYTGLNEGFKSRTDGINLLMHEFAHALWLENKMFDYEIFDETALRNYEHVADKVMIAMASQEQNFLRPYALANREEFFAVTMENFFERPQEFHRQLPELYKAVSKLVNQDPLKLQ